MPTDAVIDVKTVWPWGRQAPLRRLDDLARRKADAQEKRKRLEEVFRERLIDLDRVMESIEQDVGIAQKCEEDRCRRTVKALLEQFSRRGIEAPKEIEKRKPDQALIDELTLKLRGAPALDPVVELEESDDAVPGGSVGFEDMAGLTRQRKPKGK